MPARSLATSEPPPVDVAKARHFRYVGVLLDQRAQKHPDPPAAQTDDAVLSPHLTHSAHEFSFFAYSL